MNMMFRFLLIFALALLPGFSIADQKMAEVRINGFIESPTGEQLLVGDQPVVVEEGGEFLYTHRLERPVFLDASYGDLEWTLFLIPGCEFELLIQEGDPETIGYNGDLEASNTYLLKTTTITSEINGYFGDNWNRLHGLDQSGFIAALDSLKEVYFSHLEPAMDQQGLSKDFMDYWSAEINYGFDFAIVSKPIPSGLLDHHIS